MSLQRGMNFRGLSNISVVLMSRRASAPYDDSLSEDGAELSYEGHDVRREPGVDPKTLDQPWTLPSGKATENGQFAHAASETESPLVRACEKLRPGTWSDRGLFCLTGHEYLRVAGRMVFKFRMRLSDVSDEMVLRTAQKSSSGLFLHGLNTLCTNATRGAASFAVHLISFTSTTSSLFHEEALA